MSPSVRSRLAAATGRRTARSAGATPKLSTVRWTSANATLFIVLVGYTALWAFNPWNGPAGPWAKGYENIGGAFDRWLLGRNYSGYYVGMNAIPSAATRWRSARRWTKRAASCSGRSTATRSRRRSKPV